MNAISGIFRSINKWISPYKYHFEDEIVETKSTQGKRKKKKFKGVHKPKLTVEQEKKKKEFLATGALGIDLVTMNEILDEKTALTRLDRSKSGVAYYYHNKKHHQIAVKFEKASAWKYHARNDAKRKKLVPIIEHKVKGRGDKTHVIPIGFHGSDHDERLLVRFDSSINKGKLKTTEEYIANINKDEPVLWFVDIQRQNDDTAIWYTTVWDENSNILVKEEFHDKNKFSWS